MNPEESNSTLNTYTSTNPPLPVLIGTQFIDVEHPHIPVFFLGPSLHDYIQTVTENTSSIDSGSPPDSPPADPLSSPEHFNHNPFQQPLQNDQLSIHSTGDTEHKAMRNSNRLQQSSSTHMSRSFDTLKAGQVSFAESVESPQALRILASIDPVSSTTECQTVTENLLTRNAVVESTFVSIDNSSSNPIDLANCKSHETIPKHIGRNEHAYVDKKEGGLHPIDRKDVVDSHGRNSE